LSTDEQSPPRGKSRRWSRIRDYRVWVGIAITVVFGWFVIRDVDFALVVATIRQANWLLLIGLSVPSYLAVVQLRAMRWRHLTDPIQPIGLRPLFRATAIGFMTNNIFPLRAGEVIRPWYLGREVGVPSAALFGTVILERVIDTIMVIGLATIAIPLSGAGEGGLLGQVAIALIPVAVAPLIGLVVLRVAPDFIIGLASWFLRPFPTRFGNYVIDVLGRFGDGLGALKGGSHLFWIAFHSIVVWFVASTIPMLAGFWALGIDIGSPYETLVAAWFTLAAVGMAVAIPSAPGFFGTYHAACKLALEPFGVAPETAVALGTLLHGTFWVTLTLLGLAALRSRRTSWGEFEQAVGASESPSSEANVR
jgi:uncharacterized protein (TIRG00374 family)